MTSASDEISSHTTGDAVARRPACGGRMMTIDSITNRNELSETQPGVRVANIPEFTIPGCISNDNGDCGIYCAGSEDEQIKANQASGNADLNHRQQNCRNVISINNQ